ncbi:PD-(D/E)XK motif protein [Pseudonocardia oroxyli]|uniref:Putative PD-(D/E)XK family member n=1 Tax=Pseudonocardia oroxyli TaxID=366584 RepID=A0A1G7P9W0_PSEOR|nr:PD-(D/E)XK motif protein [Pseudonocardia oroxyli]SDF83068.1 Putative PD-(D/E)XK family member [Pseudonocardia oroxyli]
MTPDGARFEKLWSAAAVQPVASMFRTASTDIDTTHGPVLVGVRDTGARHLLVPIGAKHTLQEDVDGRAVTLRRQELEDETSIRVYASLALADDRLRDMFTALCVEVLTRVAAAPDRAVTALRRTLADWRSLLSGSRRTLTPSELAGLYGELTVLLAMLARDPGAVAFWTGPFRSRQDFHRANVALEVKSTTSVESRSVRIHGLRQLEGGDGRLLLVWLKLRTDRGRTVPDLVDEVLHVADDEAAFLSALNAFGYQESEKEVYARRIFEVEEQHTYEVGPGFPRLTPAGLVGDATLAGLANIDYDVDLDGAPAAAARTAEDPVETFLEQA